jgi:hypothetical protein
MHIAKAFKAIHPGALRAITICQPWVHYILTRQKRIENRSWKPPEGTTVLALHSAGTVDGEDWDELTEHLPDWEERTSCEFRGIVGILRVGAVHTSERTVPSDQREWFGGPFGWEITDVLMLPEVIECKGQLGLWGVSSSVQRKMADLIVG